MGRGSRAFRRKAAVDHADEVDDVEFAELLDPIAAMPAPLPLPLSVEAVCDPVEEVVPVASRFAVAGIDDDRLPVRAAKRRSRRH